jgi:hypothetical protein
VAPNRQLPYRPVTHPLEQILRRGCRTLHKQHLLFLPAHRQHVEQTGRNVTGHHSRLPPKGKVDNEVVRRDTGRSNAARIAWHV